MRWGRWNRVYLAVAAVVVTMSSGCDAGSDSPGVQPPASPYTVQPRDGGPAGRFLVAGTGWSLYIYDHDTPNVSVCLEQCAEQWPPLTIDGTDPVPHPELAGDVAAFVRPDGRRQVSLNGQPLYFYSGDSAPGETRGEGIDPAWHLARPAPSDDLQSARSAPDATFQVFDRQGWQPSSVAIAPGGTVTWRNLDSGSAHGVACVAGASSAPCPWDKPFSLPAPGRDAAGNITPAAVQVTFPRPGIFVFQCTVHPEMKGTVVVGAPATPASR